MQHVVSYHPRNLRLRGLSYSFEGWALYSVNVGGTPLYIASWAGQLLQGVSTTLPAQTFRVFAEQPS